jgi:hypothetical protein
VCDRERKRKREREMNIVSNTVINSASNIVKSYSSKYKCIIQ